MGRTVSVLCVPHGGDVVGRARLAASRHLARRLCAFPGVDQVVVASPAATSWEGLGVTVVVDPPSGWVFGAHLGEIACNERADRLVYFSAGSGVLLSDAEIERLVGSTPTEAPYAILNNFFSTDFGTVVPPRRDVLEPLARDNPLGFRLWEEGYRCYELPRSAATQFDLDTPGELQVLACHPTLPAELAEALEGIPTEAARALLGVLVRPGAQLVVVGRMGGATLRQLEARAACRVRVFSEERGMEAEGRVESGCVRSLVGYLAGCIEPEALVDYVCGLGDVVVWDTRVLLAHRGLWPPPEERFAADLLCSEGVRDPFLKRFVRACARSDVPMLLGGHTLVSGALLLALELAWQGGIDRPPRYEPLALPPM